MLLINSNVRHKIDFRDGVDKVIEDVKGVQKEINKYKSLYGKPTMKGNEAFFFRGDLLVMISYGYSNGKHYSCWQVSKS